MGWVLAAVLLAIVGGLWVPMLVRGEPWLYGALRCLRENEASGERRFVTRLLFKPALIYQTTGPGGEVNRVVVVIPHFGKAMLDGTLRSLAKDAEVWPDKDGRYEIDGSSYYRHHPGLEKVRVWGEYDPEWGVRFVAQRVVALATVPKEA